MYCMIVINIISDRWECLTFSSSWMLSGMQQIVEMALNALARILSSVSIVQMLKSERIVPS